MTQKGYLLLFDLSGYTEFLTQSNLDQAHGILQSLIGTVLEHVQPPLQVAELEGDAIFTYAAHEGFADAHALIGTIERLYCVFAATLEQMERNAACDCDGCKQFPRLDLKVIAHHGSFVLSRLLPDRPAKPVGADVVLAHRLLKNRITETTGLASYALITEACADALRPTWPAEHILRHAETYAHVGEVHAYLLDLAPAWARERTKRLVRVGSAETWIEVALEIRAPRAVVWNEMNSPEFKGLWRFADLSEVVKRPTAMLVADRCYRGETVGIDEVVDWQPLHTLTLDCEWPLGARLRVTLELHPCATGSRVTARLGQPFAAVPAQNSFVRSFYHARADDVEARSRENLISLQEMVLGHVTRTTPRLP